MTTKNILKVKVGEFYENNKSIPIFKTYFEKVSKKGETYFEAKDIIFVKQIESKDDNKPFKGFN